MSNTQQTTVLKSMGYDHPAYTTRQAAFFVRAAGANGPTAKYVAHANLLAYAATIQVMAVGNATSSYTFTGANGSATVAALSDQLSLYVVTNTSSGTASVSLSTATYGPWVVTGNFIASGTYTNQVGQGQQFQLNGTASGTAALGGVLIPEGSMFYFQGGTDTAASASITLDYNIQPLAAVAA
jgi:hypothetical protein